MEWNGIGRMMEAIMCFIILIIFYHSKWFENGLENDLKNSLKNGLTLQILRWYKWLRFKDIVQGFGKLKNMVEKSGMEWNYLED